ncbi:MAG: hypothetical protein JW864_00240 [Spirochaetes bacterium]|nr:hypothetical protein [Spirochaetota bacterium]
MAESGFNFQKFIDDSKATLTNPKSYFASMAKEGGFGEPIIKALIYGLAAGIISFIWSLIGLSAAGGMGMGMFGAGAGGIMIIIGSLITAIIGLFIGGIIVLILSAISSGSTDFEANIRVCASLMVLSPVNALLSFLGGISLALGAIVALLVSLYGLYLLYNALVSTLGGKESIAKVVSIVLAIIPVIILISTLTCASVTSNYVDKMSDSKDMKELQDKLEDMAEKMEKEMDK